MSHTIAPDLDPHDRLFAAVVRQALKDAQQPTGPHPDAARAFLTGSGLLDDVEGGADAAVLPDWREMTPYGT